LVFAKLSSTPTTDILHPRTIAMVAAGSLGVWALALLYSFAAGITFFVFLDL
jgi:hypothetical protein